jgi:predicted AlkP superfamily phosphohydrolase/phosphomutase
MSQGRVVLIGLDGMPYGLMAGFARDGTMPNFGALAREGIFRPMASSIPEISSVAWSSIITGANPGEHGMFGFIDIAPGTYRTTFPNFNSVKVKPFWEANSGRSVIVNMPTTFPAREMNGVLIAGFVALDLERATFPRSLVPTLQEMDYRVDVDSRKAHESVGFFLRDVDETLRARIAAYQYLWREEAWDTFVLVFTGTDRLAHFLWDAYEDETHKYHEAFVAHFRQIDEVIGQVAQSLDSGDLLVILSDHGFERLKKNVYVNRLLEQEGFVAFEDENTRRLNTIAGTSLAFALDPGRIYLNSKERYPRGCVTSDDREAVLNDLEVLFNSVEVEGEKVIKRVYRGEELYKGAQAHLAPDMVLLGDTGYNLRGNLKAAEPFGNDIFTGKHSQADAFLLVWGGDRAGLVPDQPSVTDVAPIISEL